MSKIEWKGAALVAPVPPALITVGSINDKFNVFTVAWTGITNTIPPKTYISVRPSRYSYELLKETGEFVINLTTEALVKSADYCGIHSGRNVNKFEKCSLSPLPASKVACPIIGESPLSLECRVTDVISLGSHDMFMADILCVDVDEELISKDGKLNLQKAKLCAFAHGEYYSLGKRLGNFGFSVAKKKKTKNNKVKE